MAPWVVRLRKVLQPYRGWPEPDPSSRWAAWVNAIEQNHAVRSTTSTDDLYISSYERYAGKLVLDSHQTGAIGVGPGAASV